MTIVSHTHRYIFLKSRKTAGTSVEKWLSGALKKGDWIATAPENLPLPVGFWDSSNTLAYGRLEKTLKRVCRYGLGFPKGTLFREHMVAAEVRAAVSETIWQSYTKIVIERDPWDRFISLWRWRASEAGPRVDFDTFLDMVELESTSDAVRGYSNLPIYTIDGAVVVDRVLRYHVLRSELDHLRSALSLPLSLDALPNRKSGYRKQEDDLRTLSNGQVARIARVCAEEISLLGWSYADLYPRTVAQRTGDP